VVIGIFSLGRAGSRLREFCREKKKKCWTSTRARESLASPGQKFEVLTGMVSLGRKLRVPIGIFSSGRDWFLLGEDFDDVNLARARNGSLERKFGVPTRVFSHGRDWSCSGKIFFAKTKNVDSP